MKTDEEIRGYLDRAQGNLAMARLIATQEHNPIRDQTLDMKYALLAKMKREENKE